MGGPIRVLHAVVNMNRGGAEMLIMNLYRKIDRSKIQFDFLTSKQGVFDEEIKAMGGKIYRISYMSEVGHRGYISALNKFFGDHSSYRAIHSHMDKMSGLVLRAAKKAGIPIRIAHSHNTRSEGGIAARIYKWYAGTHVLSSANQLVACSNTAAKWLFSGKAKEAHILHNGIDCKQFSYSLRTRADVREELQIADSTLVVGHVGRFAPQKNHSFLIDLFNQLQAVCQDSVLLLAGEGPLRREMEQKVFAYNLTEKVKFVGVRSDVERLLQAFDVFVFPSHHEGLPVTLIEAQAAGLPCIISDHITREVDLGIGLVRFLSLADSTSFIEEIVKISGGMSRTIPNDVLAQKGYDIGQTACSMVDYYLSRIEVKDENINRVYANV